MSDVFDVYDNFQHAFYNFVFTKIGVRGVREVQKLLKPVLSAVVPKLVFTKYIGYSSLQFPVSFKNKFYKKIIHVTLGFRAKLMIFQHQPVQPIK